MALSYVDNIENLLTSQNILVHLGKNLSEGVEEIVLTIRPWAFEGLTVLINRGEFDLNFMGFTGPYANYIKNPKGQTKITEKTFQRKVEVCQEYQSLLYHLLKRIVTKINDKSLPEKEKDFVENFSAQAYFRIPEYREKILEHIGREDEKGPLQEWRGTDWGLDDKDDTGKKNQYFLSLFDWEKDFYSYLKVFYFLLALLMDFFRQLSKEKRIMNTYKRSLTIKNGKIKSQRKVSRFICF